MGQNALLQTSLSGLRVLDASRVLAGPYCGQILGDLGADVIKIERPGIGDETREWGPPFAAGGSAYFLSCNRNKRSVALNLRESRGRELFDSLVAESDILIENFLGEKKNLLGLNPKRLHEINPKLIIGSITGFGEGSERPGYDFVIQGLSGLMSITGPAEGPPSKVGVAMVDVVTGLHAAVAVLAAVEARHKSGHGYTLDIPLFDCAVASQVNLAQAYLATGEVPKRQGHAHLQIAPYELFETSDNWLILAVGNDAQWQKFCRAAQAEELGEDPAFATNQDRVKQIGNLRPRLQKLMKGRSTKVWQELLEPAGIPCGPVWDYGELFESPLARERGLRVKAAKPDGTPVELVKSPLAGDALRSPPPDVGEHTDEVLSEVLGMSADQMQKLRDNGVLG